MKIPRALSQVLVSFSLSLRLSYLIHESDIIISSCISILTLDLQIELSKEHFCFEGRGNANNFPGWTPDFIQHHQYLFIQLHFVYFPLF